MAHSPDDDLHAMTERLAELEPRLDDLARERLLRRIHDELRGEGRVARARAPGYALVALLAAAAALAVWLGTKERAPAPVAEQKPAVVAPQREQVVAQEVPAFVPYEFSGGSAQRSDALLMRAQTRIALAEGERLLAMLGKQARIALVGPAVLRVIEAQSAHVELSLEQGVLLGDYDRQQGGELIIQSPGARTEIVGTLFSVRALGTESQVEVARGKVRVHAGDQRIEVGANQAWRSGALEAEEISQSAAAELARHANGPSDPMRAPEGEVAGDARTEVVAATGDEPRRPSPRGAPSSARSESAPGPESVPSAERLYADAERAMREGRSQQARALLEQMLANHPTAPNRDVALYDLALDAYKQGEFAGARALLDRLDREPPRPFLRELSAYLRCRVLEAHAPTEAPACFAEFRARFPDSPHAKGEAKRP